MKKVSKSSKKGFTLVELIVVLVILAILAAMLVPALTGYIRRARKEKNYQAAAEVLTAAQAIITEDYGLNDSTPAEAAAAVTTAEIQELTGLSGVTVSACACDDQYVINDLKIKFPDDDATYSWDGSVWSAS